MKRTRIALLAAVAFLATSSLTHATWDWSYVHGQTGHIQDATVWTAPWYMGWGLDANVNAVTTDNPGWVHYCVQHPAQTPTSTGASKKWSVRYVKIQVYMGSSDVGILAVDLWDGGTTKFLHVGSQATVGNAWNELLIAVPGGHPMTSALGVSIAFARGVESMSHRVIIGSVGARWDY